MRCLHGFLRLSALFWLTFARDASAQPSTTERCSVSVGTPGENQMLFRAPADSYNLPPPQGLWVSSGSVPGLHFKFAFAQTSGDTPNFLVISPANGVTPGWVWVSLNPNVVPHLPARTIGMALRFSLEDEPDKVCFNRIPPITLALIPSPPPSVTSVTNAATSGSDFSPGTIISIEGKNLSTPPITARYDGAGLFPTTLGNTVVLLNSTPAPLLYVSQDRIEAVIPHSLAGESAVDLIVKRTATTSTSQPLRLKLQPTAPGVFVSNGIGGGLGIYNQDGRPNGEDHPAPIGAEIQIRATGVGVWNEKLPDGSIALSPVFFPHYLEPLYPQVILRPKAPVSLTIGGQAVNILNMGPVPHEIFGTLNIVAAIPDGLSPGPQPIVLRIGDNDNARQNVTVWVQ